MAKVMIGTTCVGFIQDTKVGNKPWVASRIAVGGSVIVGSSDTQQGALTLLGRSIIAKGSEEGSLTAAQRERLRDLLAQLDGMGFGELSKAIMAVFK